MLTLAENISEHELMKLVEELRVVAPKWWELGIQLEVPLATLKIIADKNDSNAEQSLNDILREWMKRTKGVSWEAIVAALKTRSVGENHLATEIEMRHCRSGKDFRKVPIHTIINPIGVSLPRFRPPRAIRQQNGDTKGFISTLA